jgi:hypothetical protein
LTEPDTDAGTGAAKVLTEKGTVRKNDRMQQRKAADIKG